MSEEIKELKQREDLLVKLVSLRNFESGADVLEATKLIDRLFGNPVGKLVELIAAADDLALKCIGAQTGINERDYDLRELPTRTEWALIVVALAKYRELRRRP